MPVHAASITAAKPVAHGAVPHRMECCCTLKNRLLSQVICCLNSTRTLSSANLALQNTSSIAAAEYGRLAMWAYSPPLSGLGAAFTAAGWCISAGAPPRPLTRFVFLPVFYSSSFCFFRVPCWTPSSFFPERAESYFFRLFFRFCFSSSGRALS